MNDNPYQESQNIVDTAFSDRPQPKYNFMQEILPTLVEMKKRKATQLQNTESAGGQPLVTGGAGSEYATPFTGKYPITQKFGNYNPALYAGITSDSRHKGLDIGLPAGTEVYAPTSGSVTYGYDKNWGNYALVTGSDGNVYRFSHLSTQKNGSENVRAGQAIGKSGSSGHSTAAHLDLSVTQNGNYIDPLSLAWLSSFMRG